MTRVRKDDWLTVGMKVLGLMPLAWAGLRVEDAAQQRTAILTEGAAS